jgi:hypothetical protein
MGAARKQRSLVAARATVLLGGIAILPTQSGNISLLSSEAQLRAIEGLVSGSQIALPLYGDFTSPAGSPDPALSFAFSANALALLQNQGSDPAVAASINRSVTLGADEIAEGRGGSVPTVRGAASGEMHAICSVDQTETQLQGGGEFWTTQAVSATPVRFPSGVFLGNSLIADPLALGPTGDRSNLQSPGPAGSWCRPGPVPFSQSSPLESRAFWIIVFFPLVAGFVFWLSRGVKLHP